MPSEKYIGALEVAGHDEKKLAALESLCREGKVKAKLVGNSWYVTESVRDNLKAHLSEFKPKTNYLHHAEPAGRAVAALAVVIALGIGLAAEGQVSSTIATRLKENEVGTPALTASLAPVFRDVTEALAALFEDISRMKNYVSDQWFYYGSRIKLAWGGFLTEEETQKIEQVANTVNTGTTIDREQLRAEIREELSAALRASGVPAEVTQQGLIVVPSTGDPATDRLSISEINALFSDEVSVRFDESGRAGVITPKFKTGESNDYLFLLTPVNH